MRRTKEALLTLSEAVAIVGALLLLPCVLAGLAFGCEFTEPLAQALLVAAASTAILTVIAIHEGWYADHLARLAGVDEQSPWSRTAAMTSVKRVLRGLHLGRHSTGLTSLSRISASCRLAPVVQ